MDRHGEDRAEMRLSSYRSVYSLVSKFFRDPRCASCSAFIRC
jgi:hypothetical protein